MLELTGALLPLALSRVRSEDPGPVGKNLVYCAVHTGAPRSKVMGWSEAKQTKATMNVSLDTKVRFDRCLAAALRGDRVAWPIEWQEPDQQSAFVERAIYHGIAGLLMEAPPELLPWPESILTAIKRQAVGQVMWELRHAKVLGGLLKAFADDGVTALVLKGTALAYDIYEQPASRARGDTDILVETGQLAAARAILAQQGFERCAAWASANDEFQLQELWLFEDREGAAHCIDLHWQALKSPALEGVLTTEKCLETMVNLPRLCHAAWTVSRSSMLIHLTLHRASHITSPYFSGGEAHFGGDRLIWIADIDRLARVLNEEEWRDFGVLASDKGIARVCLDGLNSARQLLDTPVPARVIHDLGAAAERQPASSYLLRDGPLTRIWRDLMAVRGWPARFSYLRVRGFPSRTFMLAKYPDMASRPLALLYLRRIAEVLRKSPRRYQS